MADIFLSYARADRNRAEQVKAALEAAGLSVFFDVEGLDGGDVFPDVLDREVKTAGAVVSLWSAHALSRPWVKQECSIGLKRKCLIPLAIEPLGDLDVPVAFEGLQQIDFTGFHGRTDSPEWQKLMRSLARTLGRPDLVTGAAPAPVSRPGAPVVRRGAALGLISGALAVLLIIMFAVLRYAAPQVDVSPAETVAGSAAGAPGFNPDTEETGGTVVPAPWIEEGETAQACGPLKAHVYFEFDRTTPDIASQVVLENALARSFNCLLSEVRIEAHDDLFNSPAYAQAMSERRGSDLAALLMAKGVDGAIISTTSYGSTQPIEAGKQTPANRRATVVFVYGHPPAEAAAPD